MRMLLKERRKPWYLEPVDTSKLVVTCGECGSPMSLRDSRYGKFWGCTRYPECRGTHGAHPNGLPLGIPADEKTKRLRMEVHAMLELQWQGRTKRQKNWLLGICGREHIGEMDKDMLLKIKHRAMSDFQVVRDLLNRGYKWDGRRFASSEQADEER
jgi:hypothetical protein